ncbi:MAG TPA: HIT family protein [Terriglobales bacterium]|nr:HIT family protein [Terriglobales bacterium]
MYDSMKCRFCEIVQGSATAEVVYEDDNLVAFLDHAPLTSGHCLLIPRKHFESLLEMPPDLLAFTFTRTQTLAMALMKAMGAEGMLIASNTVVQQTVPHFHVHLVPRWHDDELGGFSPRKPVTTPLAEVAQHLRRTMKLT